MKFVIQAVTIAAFVFLTCPSTAAQISNTTGSALVLEQGVAPHKGLDGIYRRFSEGYKKLDAASVAELYSETAAYLAPGDNIQTGRQKILGNFSSFFNSIKQRNGRAEISFRIVQRQVDKKLAYDVGIYTLTSFNEKGEARRSSGKFVVVAIREKSDVWRFQVDGYSDLPRAPQ